MIETHFTIKDIASHNYYKIYHQNDRWWIFNMDGEGVEIDLEVVYSMIDKYFKENI